MNKNIIKKFYILIGALISTMAFTSIGVYAQASNYRIYNGLDYTYTSWGGYEEQGVFGNTSRVGNYGSLDGNGGNTCDGQVQSNGAI